MANTEPGLERRPAFGGRTTSRASTANLRSRASRRLGLVAADKLDNVRSIAETLEYLGHDQTWAIFNAKQNEQHWYYSELARILIGKDPESTLFSVVLAPRGCASSRRRSDYERDRAGGVVASDSGAAVRFSTSVLYSARNRSSWVSPVSEQDSEKRRRAARANL